MLPELQDVRQNQAKNVKEVADLLSPREFDVFCLTAHEVALGYKTVANYNLPQRVTFQMRYMKLDNKLSN